MKIVFLSISDIVGGASKATYNLHKAMLSLGIESKMLVLEKKSGDDSVVRLPKTFFEKLLSFIVVTIDQIPLGLYPNRQNTFWSTGWLNYFKPSKHPILQDADVVCLCWVGGGFLGAKEIGSIAELGKQVFWRLSDVWAMTGGCHYFGDCEKYKSFCHECTILKSNYKYDVSYWLFRQKLKYWKTADFSICCPSKWIADCSVKSELFGDKKTYIIGSGVNTELYKKRDKKYSREMLSLNPDTKLILLGAGNILGDKRKGADLAFEAVGVLKSLMNDFELVVFGSSDVCLLDGVKINNVGILSDDVSLAALYSACDVFVAPSREENLANTVLESLSCGTPVVAFNIGGMPDVIEHLANGYLATPFDIIELANGIEWVLNNEDCAELSIKAREKIIREFDDKIVAKKYIDLYERVSNIK